MFNKVKGVANSVTGLVKALDTVAKLAKYAAAVGDILQYAADRFQQINEPKKDVQSNENSEHTS